MVADSTSAPSLKRYFKLLFRACPLMWRILVIDWQHRPMEATIVRNQRPSARIRSQMAVSANV